jgi:predicted TPR repeat methyltransferase
VQASANIDYMTDNPNLENAYALRSPDEMKTLYENWADHYDISFGQDQGYQTPREVAVAFAAAGGGGPVLDVGAGTGLVAAHLHAQGITDIDALDLSDEMLRVAGEKGLYRDLIAADVTQPLPHAKRYAGIVSAGTFTLGHVGPEGVVALMDAAAQNALFVISVNALHYESAGFADMITRLGTQITALSFKDVRIYDDRADEAHRNDIARLLIFRKT